MFKFFPFRILFALFEVNISGTINRNPDSRRFNRRLQVIGEFLGETTQPGSTRDESYFHALSKICLFANHSVEIQGGYDFVLFGSRVPHHGAFRIPVDDHDDLTIGRLVVFSISGQTGVGCIKDQIVET